MKNSKMVYPNETLTNFLQEAAMHTDSIALLGECTAKINLSLSTIDRLLPSIKDRNLRYRLQESAEDQRFLRNHACALLKNYGGSERSPSALVQGMTQLKTSTRLALRNDDTTIAYLVAEGCDQGVKSLSRSQNRHCMADPDAIQLSQELIRCQDGLSARLRPYL